MVEVMLARPATALPGEDWAYEPKWDGWRGLLSRERLLSRHGKDLTRHFPELLGLLPAGTLLDGEIICWHQGRLDFTGLQRRVRGSGEQVCFVAFDLLKLDGQDLRPLPYRDRRRLLERLPLRPPLVLVESSTERCRRAALVAGLPARRSGGAGGQASQRAVPSRSR